MGVATFSNNSTIKIAGGGFGTFNVGPTVFTTSADQYAIITVANGGTVRINGSDINVNSNTIYVPQGSTITVGAASTVMSWVIFENTP